MSIEKSSSDKLFFRPTIKRDEPYVKPADVVVDVGQKLDQENNYSQFIDNVNLLRSGFKNLLAEYEKILSVYIKRADLRNISLDLSKINANISSSLYAIFGRQKETLTLADYIELSKYEYSLYASYAAINLDTSASLENLQENAEQLLTNTMILNIGTIKSEFQKYIQEIGAYDLLFVDMIIKDSAEAGSALASINNVAQTILDEQDPQNITDQEKKNFVDKVGDILEECIPCFGRNIDMAFEIIPGGSLSKFFDLMWKSLSSKFKSLLDYKLRFIDTYYFSKDICRLIDYLRNNMCLPDLAAIVSLLGLIKTKFINLFKTEFKGIGLGIPLEPATIAINFTIDGIFSLLTKLMNTLFSSLECIVISLENEARKLNVGGNVFDMNALKQTRYSSYNAISDLAYAVYSGKEKLKADIDEVIKEIEKHMRFSLFAEDTIADLWYNIEKYEKYISLIREIILVAKNLKNIVDKDLLRKMHKAICAAAYSNSPWIQIFSDPVGPTGPTGPNLPSDPDSPGPFPPPIGDPGDDGDGIDIYDLSLPPGFFDDPWIDDINNPRIKDFNNNDNNWEDLENGQDILRFDYNKLSDYISKTERAKTTGAVSITISTGQTLTALPVIYLSFASCLSGDGLDIDENQIQEWINRIN